MCYYRTSMPDTETPSTQTVPRGLGLQDRTAAAILEEAARVLAEHREATSLSDIAQAAGVARSTLYRYFPSREALLEALSERAMGELGARIEEAQVDTLPVPDALARLTRGFISTGAKYVALAYLSPKPSGSAERAVNAPVARLFERGVKDGSLRGDLPVAVLLAVYSDLVQGAISRAAHYGVEPTGAAVLAIFLEGALGTPAGQQLPPARRRHRD
jgi:TetR/AcrR family transcriptional regulator, mexCD-oprJ operon repressor